MHCSPFLSLFTQLLTAATTTTKPLVTNTDGPVLARVTGIAASDFVTLMERIADKVLLPTSTTQLLSLCLSIWGAGI